MIKLVDGSVWEQAEYYYHYQYRYRPEVLVEGNRMHVEGMSRAVRVRRVH